MISLFCFQKGLIQVLPIHGIIPYEPTAINSNKKKKLIDREYIRGFKHGLGYILVVKCGVKIL